jgi:FAD/FMN-containing dehydrogenase/Fe-S oxidoreductase
LDRGGLERDLKRQLACDVRFDDGTRALYSTDASNYRQVPIGVVLPRRTADVVAALDVCRRHGAAVLARGGGTSLAGQCCNVAVVLDTSKHLNRILAVDPARRIARVEPGLVLDDLRSAAAPHGLTFGPDPASHSHCTLGGMIGNDSCGVHSLSAGRTSDNVEVLDVVTYRGLRLEVGATPEGELARILEAGGEPAAIYRALVELRDQVAPLVRERYPKIPRRVSGYNLDDLLPERGLHVARSLVGSESTCVLVLEATLRLVPRPASRVLLLAAYPDVYQAADDVPAVLEHGPIGLEGFDDRLLNDMKSRRLHSEGVALLPQGGGWLIIELGGETERAALDQAQRLQAALQRRPNAPATTILQKLEDQRRVWKVRESALGATAVVPGQPFTWEGWEDAAVPPAKLGGYLRDFRALLNRFGYRGAFYGHFGQGCLHTRTDFDLASAAGIRKYRDFVHEAADLVVSYGGSLSGEHGDGQARAELLPKMFGAELVEAFARFKAIWDPDGRMNPGKVVAPYRVDENLRLGAGFAPAEPATHFRFPEDGGRFARAAMRCVGVGACRRTDAGTMCPSYRATGEEKHSTRGRARLLFEMLRDGPRSDLWRDENVREALDLCLACKACKGECPTQVDMATYKAEFLSHYYEGRLRPRHAYAFGWIRRWTSLAAHAPGLANLLTQTPVLRSLAGAAAGMAPERRIPRFARGTFRRWFRRRPRRGDGVPVLLWPDTFNDHFHPETAEAAVAVLEAFGYQVRIPQADLCCGRPFYDYGMLGPAKATLRRTLDALRSEGLAGLPVVCLEPSCASVFRDELPGLFPEDDEARGLAERVQTLAELLGQEEASLGGLRLTGRALLQGHCHQQALRGLRADERLLRRLGLQVDVLDAGCCGMAGAFGFERDHYALSMAIGERVLLPAVRGAPADSLVVADGFSCREQIAQGTGRRALHLAEVLFRAMETGA